jgi:hypothetical protein
MLFEKRIANCKEGAPMFDATKPVKLFLEMSNISTDLGKSGTRPVSWFDWRRSLLTDMNSKLSGNLPLIWLSEMSKDVAREKEVQNQIGNSPMMPVLGI